MGLSPVDVASIGRKSNRETNLNRGVCLWVTESENDAARAIENLLFWSVNGEITALGTVIAARRVGNVKAPAANQRGYFAIDVVAESSDSLGVN